MKCPAPVTREEAEQLVLLYNRLTSRCSNVPRNASGQPVGRPVNRQSVKEATDFLRFCAENAIDPERWIVARHEALGWARRLGLKDLGHVGPNFLDHFRTWGDTRAMDAQRAVQPVEDFDRLSTYAEQLKARCTDREVCMVLPDTRGWNPASAWCEKCELATRCRSRLPSSRRVRREAIHARE